MVTFTHKLSLMQMGCKMLRKKGFRHAEVIQGPVRCACASLHGTWPWDSCAGRFLNPFRALGKRVERVRDANSVQRYKVNESGVWNTFWAATHGDHEMQTSAVFATERWPTHVCVCSSRSLDLLRRGRDSQLLRACDAGSTSRYADGNKRTRGLAVLKCRASSALSIAKSKRN